MCQGFSPNKEEFEGKKTLSVLDSSWGKRIPSTPAPSGLSVSSKRIKNIKKMG